MPSKVAPKLAAAASKPYDPHERSKYTDQANAERFQASHEHDVIYVPEWDGWLVYDGKSWRIDKMRLVEAYAQIEALGIWDEIPTLSNSTEKELCAKWATTSEKSKSYQTMLDRAKPLMAVSPDIFDTNPHQFNCLNGTIDLRTGILHAHNPDDLITKMVPVGFHPDAECPLWEAHLEKVLPNPAIREFLQRAFGYAAMGTAIERIMLFFYGRGANGKSLTINAIQRILGDYAATASPTLIVKSRDNQADLRALIALRGFRLVTTIDQQEAGARIAEASVKMVTSDDPITGRRLYHGDETFDPTHTLCMSANTRPIIMGTDDAIWDRIAQIPFDVRIPEDERDPDLGMKMRDEYEGILAWLVRGAVEYSTNGLQIPDEVRTATQEYRDDMDLFGDFLTECIEDDPTAFTPMKDIYIDYEQWAAASGSRAWMKVQVSRELEKRKAYSRATKKNVRGFNGLRLKSLSSPFGPPMVEEDDDDD